MLVDPVWVWGLPLAPLRQPEVVSAIDSLIKAGRPPSYFITANTHYAMLSHRDWHLRLINTKAAFLLADGIPLVWASRWRRQPLPERVAGSDLIYDLCALAAERGYRVFFLGGPPGVAEEAARRLTQYAPGLRVVGTESPPFRPLSTDEQVALHNRIRSAAPDLLLTAFTMPRGECWVADHAESLGVPVCVNVGAAIDFAAGRVRRAPRWLQRLGLEWAYRISTDPRRLGPRYARNALFLAKMLVGDLVRGPRPESPLAKQPSTAS